jgi:hypothetical protein
LGLEVARPSQRGASRHAVLDPRVRGVAALQALSVAGGDGRGHERLAWVEAGEGAVVVGEQAVGEASVCREVPPPSAADVAAQAVVVVVDLERAGGVSQRDAETVHGPVIGIAPELLSDSTVAIGDGSGSYERGTSGPSAEAFGARTER